MSMKLSFCLKAATTLTEGDLGQITDAIEAYVRGGMDTEQAESMAVGDLMAQVMIERTDMTALLRQQHPDLFQADRPALATKPAAPDDLGAMFDDLMAEEATKPPAVPAKERRERAKKTVKQAARSARASEADDQAASLNSMAKDIEREPIASVVSAAKNTAKAVDDAIAGLGKLFGGNKGTLGSGPVFNEETYAAAKPLFASAVANLQNAAADIKQAMREVIRMVVDRFGRDVAENMKPYVVRFIEDLRDGKAELPTKEAEDGQSNAGAPGAETLDDVAAGEGPGAAGGGQAGRGGAGGRGRRSTRNAGTGEPRVSGARSGGSGSTSVRAPAAGAGGGGQRRRGKGTARDGAGVPASDARDGLTPVSVPNIPAVNYRITDDTRLGKGGEAEKFRDNVAAIKALKAIEAEDRRATPAEQRVLARYVGWGGLANAFAAPESGKFKPDWEDRGKSLVDLLTPKELALARRSTLDAHYTSEDVIGAMWSAARRLGFAGGSVLESSMGVGNFLGLLPEDLTANTKFVGVEYDSLTARIAALLYPNETVLHSGFQKVPVPDGAFDLSIGNPPFGEQSLRFQFKPELNRTSIHNQFIRAALDAVKPGGLQIQVVSRYLMDKQDSADRLAIAGKARLLGAIRLPDTAFKENARTEVVTDILFFQRLTAEEEAHMASVIEAAKGAKEKDWKKEQARKALADEMPAWVEVGTVPDPLGGEAMTVNRYFQRNQHMIMGTLERSGSMQFQNDITVRLDKGNSLPDLLNQAIENLPEGVLAQAPDAIAASIERFKSMSDGLRIALSGQESGHILLDADGKLQQVVERETPEGGHELAKRELTAASPWSDTLLQQSDGKWYTLEVKLDEKGQPVKVVKGDKTTKLNVYERKVYDSEAQIPAGLLLGDAKYARLVDLVKLRDLYVKQINLETEDAPEAKMEGNRAKLAEAYKTFTAAHGWVSDPSNEALVRNMPDGALISSLEVSYKPAISPLRAKNTGETARPAIAKPSDILTRRVVPKYEPPGTASTPADALQISLSEFGKVNLERMGALLGMSPEEVVDALHTNLEKPLIYKDPESQRWETRNDYLSGHVKRKLIVARSLGLAKNITALEEVQPELWGAESVSVILGATWVPPQIYGDFVKRITGVEARVSFSELTNTFAVQMVGTPQQAALDEWGADGMSPQSLIQHMLNSKPTRVYDETLDGPKLNVEKTALAGIKATQIASEFTDWVFTDGERRAKLVEVFNEKFNTRVTRQHDGSHLVLPGKVPDAVVAMRRHQLNAIWRGISERFTLYDHVVGAGKTFTAIARVMERRRMGLSRKPMIAVPNHMVEQFTTDVYRLYPGAKVLAAGKADFEKRRRRKLFAKIASGDWDVVIVPHSSFGFIGISQETEERYLEQEIETAEKAIKAAWEESGEVESKGGRGAPKPLTVKEAERLRDKLTARMDKIKGKERRDRLLTFEQMGVDDLTVDEAHEFKNLFYSSRLADVRGMGNRTGSQKAFDLYSKVRVLTESPTGSVTFMTGTPISNSAVEMYSVLRYLAAKELKELGLEHFDAFRTQYVSAEPGFEPTESGRLKEVTRLGRSWSNMRSLMDLYYSVTDAVTIEDIKKAYAEDNPGQQFPVPTVKGGERQSVIVKPTEAQVEHLEQILEEFDSLPNIKDPYDRNIARLKLMDRARKISLDTRAAFPGADTNEKGGKLDVIADNAKRIYDQWDADKGTQLIFLDRSVPKAKGDDKILKDYDALVKARDAALAAQDEDGYRQAVDKLEAFNGNEMEELRIAQAGGWNAYQQIKDNLIARGIPAGEIRFIQEATNDAQKQALFDAVNDGTVRVLIGSTQRMGAGTNVQQRLVGLHHADVTWKPSDIEQREGRIVRQPRGDGGSLIEKYGVGNFEVEILAYATERTMDAKMWALNSTKLKTINAIRKYDGAFTMDFEDEDSISMAELAALASGDPLLLERVKLTSEIDKLALLQRQHQRKNWGIESSIESAQSDIKNLPAKIVANQRLAEELRRVIDRLEAGAAARRVTVEGKEYAKMVEAVAAAEASIETQQAGNEKARYSVTVDGKKFTNKEGYLGAIHGAIGDFEPFEVVMDGQTYRVRTDVQRELASKARDIAERLANGTSETVKLGTFAGLRFEMDVSVSSGGSLYWADLSVIGADGQTVRSNTTERRDNSVFTTQSFMNALRGIDLNSEGPASQAEYLRKRLERSKESLPGLLEKRGQPFPQADEMRAKQDRLEEVIKILSSGPKVPTTDERDIRAEEWDMANPTGWPNIPDMNFSLEQEDFQDTEVLPPMTGVEVQERGLRKEDADGLAMVEKAFRTKIEQFKGLKLTLLPTPSKPADNAPKAEKVRYAAVDLAARLFGKRVIFYRANMQFANGIQADYVPGAIFVNEATTRPWMAVIGHELLHALQQDQPALYAKLGDRLRSLLENPGAYGEELNRRRAARGMPPLGFDKLREELIADIVGDNFTDPVFWRQMAAGQPSMFQRVLQAIRDFFDAILAKLENERPYDTKRYLNDVRAARDAVADAMKAFAESPTSTAGAKSIEANLDATNDPFYSALAREIELAPMNGGTAEAWRNLLKGLVAKGTVKADELTWSGIEDWLGMQAGRIPRATVMEYLSANGVKLTETVLGGKDNKAKDQQAKLDKVRDEYNAWLRENSLPVRSMDEQETLLWTDEQRMQLTVYMARWDAAEQGTKVSDRLKVELDALGFDTDTDMEGQLDTVTRRSDDKAYAYDADTQQFLDMEDEETPLLAPYQILAKALGQAIEEETDEAPQGWASVGGAETRYDQYTLPGGANYREMLLTLPAAPDTLRAVPHPDYTGADHALQKPDGSYIMNPQTGRPMRWDSRDLAERYGKASYDPGHTKRYRSSHWAGTDNVLAHIRVNERTDADGNRVLFVEEIQSDWAQQGKKYGFAGDGAQPSVDRDLAYRQARDALARNDDLGFDSHMEAINAIRAERATWRESWDVSDDDAQIIERYLALPRQAHSREVPKAPFVGKTDAWVALAVKRIIKLAVDEGFDRVAFVNGQQSADRYSLEKHIERLRWFDASTKRQSEFDIAAPNGRGHLMGYDAKGGLVLDKEMDPKDMENWVGKEVAQKLLEAPAVYRDMGNGVSPGGHSRLRELKGMELRVGGEGMKAFYDQIVPKVVKEVLRKVGGGQIGEVTIGKNRLQLREQDGGWVIADTKASTFYQGPRSTFAWGVKPKVYLSESSAQLALDALPINDSDVALQQPGFDITPAMREKAAGGLPMFSLPAQKDQTETPEFKRWFSDSKVVDAEGKPLVVYHGTWANDFTTFGGANYFTADPSYAAIFAGDTKGSRVMPAYLSLQKPLDATGLGSGSLTLPKLRAFFEANGVQVAAAFERRITESYRPNDLPPFWELFSTSRGIVEDLAKAGFDGLVLKENVGKHVTTAYVNFRPEQIKSAIGNRGTFDPASGDINLSLDEDQLASPGLARRITQGLHDLVDSPETFNWWHKGPGTQFHKATVSSLFKAVFDIAQDYIHDTSAFANRAADFAPTLLPSLSKFTDLFKRLSLKPVDQAAAADAIFTGTLDNVVYSEAELDRMGLTEKQKSLYAEFRMAVDKSLDQLVAAEVARLVGELADPYKPLIQADKLAAFERNVRKAVIAQKDAADTFLADVRKRHKRERAQMAKAHELEASDIRNTRPPAQSLMEDRHRDARNGLALRQGQEKYRAEKELQHWEQMEWDVADRYEKIDTLKENGYAPLMRFGQYTMTVRERESGDVAFFGMYESRLELNRAARAAVADYDREFYSVEKGTMSAEAWKLFKGVSPETLAIFGDAAGMDKGDNKALFDKYIRLATSNHSALKRLLHRKKTPGFSKDPSRVLAAFITSNARRSAQQLHFGDMSKAVNAARESKQGDVADEAWRLQDYMQNPQEEAAAAKSLMFVQYLGGSVASAMVNMTQPITTTLPYLSSVSNPAAALASISKAIAQLAPGAIDPRSDLGKALKMAEDEGIVAPQEMHELQAEATRTLIDRIPFARDTMRKIMFGWGSLFSAAELINRRITFVAAYNMAAGMDPAKLAKLGYPSPFGFAANAVDETQFVYTKASRPRWARGAIGGLLLTFKTYSISYLELFWRLPKREKVLMLGTLMLMAGASGMPGADDLDDVVDAFGQRLGYDTNSKDFRQRVLTEAFGPQWAAFVQRGVTGLAGSPIDVAGRLSMGNLIPGTGLLRKDLASPERELFDVAGPLGSYIKGLVDAARGDVTKALPSSIANVIKAADMLRTGAYRDARGNTVIQTTKTDAAVKAVGFQPGEVAQVQRDSQIKAQRTALARTVESEIVADWAAGIFEKDKAKQDAARRRLIEWNQKNPRTPIEVTDEQIEKRVESMMLTRQQRMLKAAPREMRPTLR